MTKIFAFSIVLLAACVIFDQSAMALSCAPSSITDRMDRAPFVFIARVESAGITAAPDYATELENPISASYQERRTIRVRLSDLNVFKGEEVPKEYLVPPVWNSTRSPLSVGVTYLFIGSRESIVGDCQPSFDVKNAHVVALIPLLDAFKEQKIDSFSDVWRFGESNKTCSLFFQWNVRDYSDHRSPWLNSGGLSISATKAEPNQSTTKAANPVDIRLTSQKNVPLAFSINDIRQYEAVKVDYSVPISPQQFTVPELMIQDIVSAMRSSHNTLILENSQNAHALSAHIGNQWFEESYENFARCADLPYIEAPEGNQ